MASGERGIAVVNERQSAPSSGAYVLCRTNRAENSQSFGSLLMALCVVEYRVQQPLQVR